MSRSSTGPGPGPKNSGPGPEVRVQGPQKVPGPDLDRTLDSLIGMRGKMFCRACWVKGADVLVEPVITERNNHQGESDADSGRLSDGNVGRACAEPLHI